MKPFITALLLMAGTFSPVSAANWIPLPASESAEVDTDSYVDSGVRASMDLKLSLDGTSVISTMEFDKDRRTYHIAAVKTLAADGSVKESTRFSDDSWSPLLPNSFGRNVYTHFIDQPIPHFTNPQWLPLFKESGVKFHGSTYDIEKQTLRYKNGYATFFLRIAYPWKDQDFSQVIYHIRMDVPNKKVQTLSMTEYDFDGKIKNHGRGSTERAPILPDTPMDQVHRYIKGEVDAGRLK